MFKQTRLQNDILEIKAGFTSMCLLPCSPLHNRANMEDSEIWKSVVGYEGIYEVSNYGRMKSFNKKLIKKGGIMTPYLHPSGYLNIGITKNRKLKTKKVHQVIAEAFLGHVCCGHKIVVDHIDNNKLNNHISNLQLITQRRNIIKSISKRSGTSSKYLGVDWHKNAGLWRAQMNIKRKSTHLGYFENELDAANAYKEAKKNQL